MDKFFIDRHFGSAIFVEVENGIVQNITNESPKFIATMMEDYKGKTITYLKEHFEARMKGTYHNLRSIAIVDADARMEAVQTRLNRVNTILSDHTITGDRRTALETNRDELVREHSSYEATLKEIRERLAKEHQYNFKF